MIAAGVFNYFGRPLSYNLLKLVHSVAAVESSILDRLTTPVAVALIGVPGGYYALTRRLTRRQQAPVFLVVILLVWSASGCWFYYQRPKPYFMPHLSVNPHIELVRSTWKGVTGLGKPSLQRDYPREYQDEFKPRVWRQAAAERDVSDGGCTRGAAQERDRHRARVCRHKVSEPLWEQLQHDSALVEEAAHALVFENFYAHIPRTSFSFVALNFSIYPGLPWCYAPGKTFAPYGARALPQTLASLLKSSAGFARPT